MDHLTLADITESSIEQRKRDLQRCQCAIEEMHARMAQLQSELEDLMEQRTKLEKDLQWRELMAESEAMRESHGEGNGQRSASIKAEVAERITLAVGQFKCSLEEPAEYQAECAADSGGGESVPYCDTDDYADLTALDAAVEDLVEEARDQLVAHAAPYDKNSAARRTGSGNVSGASSRMSSFASDARQQSPVITPARSEDQQAKDAWAAQERRRALLKLLIVSLYVGRLEELCGFDAMADPTNAPTSEAEDIREEVAGVWQYVLHESHVLTPEENAEWRGIVADFLGSPFDAAP